MEDYVTTEYNYNSSINIELSKEEVLRRQSVRPLVVVQDIKLWDDLF